MISVSAVIAIILIHFVADFVLQTDMMAKNKSSSNFWLWLHVSVYSLCLWPLCIPLGFWKGALFTAINYVAHFATDYVSSRMTTALYKAGKRHKFFIVIGADQALHMMALVSSYAALR